MLDLLEALQIQETCIWEHSDGAVIGAIMAITAPPRVRGLIFEGGHLYCRKPLSRSVFEQLCSDPTLLPLPAQKRMILSSISSAKFVHKPLDNATDCMYNQITMQPIARPEFPNSEGR